MYRILLVYPYSTQNTDDRWYPAEPLGLLYVGTYLNRVIREMSLNVELKILDTHMEGAEVCVKTQRGFRSGMTDEEISGRIKAFEPHLVGITNNYTSGAENVVELMKTIKQVVPACKIILGGAHATIAHKQMIEIPEVDGVVRGEGEETFKELVLALINAAPLSEIMGLTFKQGGQVRVNEDRPMISNIDTIPIPDRELLSYTKYLTHSSKHYLDTLNKPIGTMITSRGCPYHCIFCSTQKVWRNLWRPRSPENVIEEIEYLMRNYGVKEVSFQDDQFMGDKERIKQLCRIIIDRKLDISMIVPPGISPSLIDEDTLRHMAAAGFYRICFSIDVGTESSKKFVRKPVQLKLMRSLVRQANRIGFWTYGTFVIGFPNESLDDVHATISYAYRLGLDYCIFYIAQPHLGSDLYDLYVERGKIDVSQVLEYHTMNESLYGTDHISAGELVRLRDSAARGYFLRYVARFLNPIYVVNEFLPKISSVKRFRYFMRLFSLLRIYK